DACGSAGASPSRQRRSFETTWRKSASIRSHPRPSAVPASCVDTNARGERDQIRMRNEAFVRFHCSSTACKALPRSMIRTEPLRLLKLTLPAAAENVALDEALLRSIEEADEAPVLRVWELDRYAVVVGRANRVERNVNIEACRKD